MSAQTQTTSLGAHPARLAPGQRLDTGGTGNPRPCQSQYTQRGPIRTVVAQITAALDVPLWRLFVSAEQAKLLAQQAETDKVAELSRTVETLIRQLKQRRSGKR
jgi:hypothetical protein